MGLPDLIEYGERQIYKFCKEWFDNLPPKEKDLIFQEYINLLIEKLSKTIMEEQKKNDTQRTDENLPDTGKNDGA